MIGSIFFLTHQGELIAYKELIKLQQKPQPLKFCLSFKRNMKKFPKVIKADNLYYVTCVESEVAAVAVCEDENVNLYTVFTALTDLCKVYGDLLARVNEGTIRRNIALFYEVLDEGFCLGMPKELDVSILKPKLCNLTCVRPKDDPSWIDNPMLNSVLFKTDQGKHVSEDKAEKPVYSGSREREVFVDLVQQMVINIDKNGSVVLNEIKGSLEVKSFLQNPCSVKVAFSESSLDCLNQANFSQSVKRNSPKQIHFTADPGSHRLFSFFTNPKTFLDLPFTLYSQVNPLKDDKTLNIELKIYCSVQQPLEVRNFSGRIALPSRTLSCSGRSSLASMQFEKNKDEFEFHCPVFPSNSHHTVVVDLFLERINRATRYELERGVVFKFEAPNYSPSNLHVTQVHIEEGVHGGGGGREKGELKKYLRQLAHSNCYKFQLDTSKLQGDS